MSRGVVVGYDGSDCAKVALHAALEVARAYSEPLTIAFGYEVSIVGGEMHDYLQALQELATRRLEEARQLTEQQDGVEIEEVIVEKSPAHALADLADERDARVIVVGTRGESALRGALLGSTPHRLLGISHRPVLVVPIDHD